MKTNHRNMKVITCVILAAAVVSGCTIKKSSDALSGAQMAYNATDPNVDVPGMGSTSTTTTDSVTTRIAVGLQGTTVSPLAGSYRTVLTQVATNLPQTPDPIKAVGWDQTPILIYAACSDVNTTQTQSVYGVNTNTGQSVAGQRAALIAAG